MICIMMTLMKIKMPLVLTATDDYCGLNVKDF